MKKLLLFGLMVCSLLSCTCTDMDNGFEFYPSSLEFDSNGGVSVLSMKGNAASSTDFCGFYGVSENGVFHYCSTEEQVRQNRPDGSLISVSCHGLSVTVKAYENCLKEYVIEASSNDTGTPKEYYLQFTHGNAMATYIVKQK